MLTQEELKKNLEYDPLTGDFKWIISKKGHKLGTIAGTKCKGYIRIKLNQVKYRAHKLAWLYIHGILVENTVDHIDGDPFNNKISNLRQCTRSQNSWNSKTPKNSTTGVKNVIFTSGKYSVRIKKYGITYCFGSYDTLDKAQKIAEESRIKLHGEYARHQ